MRVGKFTNFMAMRIVHGLMAGGLLAVTLNWLLKTSDIIVFLISPLIGVTVLFTSMYCLEILYLTVMLLRARVAEKTEKQVESNQKS